MLMGCLTRDPELRVTPKGTPICQFSLAINRQFKSGDETREEVLFVDVEAWGKQGETIAKHCAKGKPLYVDGRLRLDQWEDKNTKEKRSRMKVVLENFQFLGSATDGERAPAPAPTSTPAPARGQQSIPQTGVKEENLDEDVPF